MLLHTATRDELLQQIEAYNNPKRIALSVRYPFFAPFILAARRGAKHLKDRLNPHVRFSRKDTYYPSVVARHQSLLRRRLGDSNPRLQEQKIKNLEAAVQHLDKIVIQPGDIFSLWQIVGKPNAKRGFVNGMLLSNGKVVEGMGGGLCQLSNFLYWIFLHAPTETIERFHHSIDVFPDSGRVLPFGSGATIMYNLIDVKVRNTATVPLQLRLWITDTHLKGQLRAPVPIPQKYHVVEKHHKFIRHKSQFFRYNQIYREEKVHGVLQNEEHVATNFAPVMYHVDPEYLARNDYTLMDFSHR